MAADSTVTRLLDIADRGDPRAGDELLPIVYAELKRLAAAYLSNERPGQTLQPTALVHEAYLRLVGDGDTSWNGRGHFFGAAAQAMRRILVDRAREHGALKRGGGWRRRNLDEHTLAAEPEAESMLLLDEAITRLEAYDSAKNRIVLLRFFAGLTLDQTASVMGMSISGVREEWEFIRAWLQRELERAPGAAP